MPSASNPHFLTLDQILLLHEQVRSFGGGENGIIYQGLLESAVNAPQATYGGKHLNSFPFEMAAAYLVSISRHHVFQDGNKRIASAAASIFLLMNGNDVVFPNAEQEVELVVGVATGMTKKESAVAIFKQFSKKKSLG